MKAIIEGFSIFAVRQLIAEEDVNLSPLFYRPVFRVDFRVMGQEMSWHC
jgi:hypothetical protein